MKCRMLALLLVAAVASAQFNGPYSEAQLRDLPNRYGNSFFETINPVGTGVLLQNQRPDPGFDLVNQEEWLTIYDNPASTIAPQSCGNGIREGYEVCDVLADWSVNPTCIDQGFNAVPLGATNVACTNDCTWDHQGITNWACGGTLTTSPSGYCGDGIIQPFEQCDFVNLDPTQPLTGSASCQSLGLGFDSGALGCKSFPGALTTVLSCAFDFSNCRRSTPGCGNGILEGVEQCDPPGSTTTIACGPVGSPSGGFPNLGFVNGAVSGGHASCSATCMWDVGFCLPYGAQTTAAFQAGIPPTAEVPLCGNSQIDDPEQCDGTNLQGQNCAGLGFTGGVLACSGCHYDIRGCSKQGGLVTVAAVGPDVTSVAVGDVVALSPSASCIPFSLNSYIEGRTGYCLVDESSIAVTLQEGNLFFDKSDVTTQAGFRNGIPFSGDLGTRTNF